VSDQETPKTERSSSRIGSGQGLLKEKEKTLIFKRSCAESRTRLVKSRGTKSKAKTVSEKANNTEEK
jgi:hypothetical protein